MDEDHIDTYRLGEVYASSGIRRRNEDGLIHEIDWALFDFQNERLPQDNLIPRAASGSARSTTSVGNIHPTEVVPAKSLPGLEVQCIARTSGLQMGQILPALTSVKIYGRTSPKVYPRSTLPLGIPGDSGAWVVDRPYGRLCGHVLAWSERKQVAYICPMEVLLLDIAETLEARDVRLPGGQTIIRMEREAEEEEVEEVVEVSDLDDWSEQGSIGGDAEGEEEEEGEDVPPLQEVHGTKSTEDVRASKRLSTVKREQRLGRYDERDDLAADVDKMRL